MLNECHLSCQAPIFFSITIHFDTVRYLSFGHLWIVLIWLFFYVILLLGCWFFICTDGESWKDFDILISYTGQWRIFDSTHRYLFLNGDFKDFCRRNAQNWTIYSYINFTSAPIFNRLVKPMVWVENFCVKLRLQSTGNWESKLSRYHPKPRLY